MHTNHRRRKGRSTGYRHRDTVRARLLQNAANTRRRRDGKRLIQSQTPNPGAFNVHP